MTIGLLNPVNGLHNVIDDTSGRKIRSDRSRKQWDGIITSGDDFDPKHPQLMLRARSFDTSVTPTRVRTTDIFVTSVNPDSLNGRP